jgi:quercetin dioxygenase-like cupin family protein
MISLSSDFKEARGCPKHSHPKDEEETFVIPGTGWLVRTVYSEVRDENSPDSSYIEKKTTNKTLKDQLL